jgi:hypothetical protein
MMLLAAGLAFYKGWMIHSGRMAVLAYGLGVVALALAVWHLIQKTPRTRG